MSSGLGGVSKCCCCTHTFTRTQAASHRQPHPGEMFWPVLIFLHFQPGFGRDCFLPLPMQPYAVNSRETNTLESIAVKTHPAAFPEDSVHLQSKKKSSWEPSLTVDPYKKVKLKHQRQWRKQIQVVTSQNEGAAAVKAPLFWFVFNATHTCRYTPIIMNLHNTAFHCNNWQLTSFHCHGYMVIITSDNFNVLFILDEHTVCFQTCTHTPAGTFQKVVGPPC